LALKIFLALAIAFPLQEIEDGATGYCIDFFHGDLGHTLNYSFRVSSSSMFSAVN